MKTRLFIVGFFLCLTVFFFARGCDKKEDLPQIESKSLISGREKDFRFFPLKYIEFGGTKNLPGDLMEVPGGVVASGDSATLEKIGVLLKSLDQAPETCLIDVALIVTDLGDSKSCGFDILLSSVSEYVNGVELAYDAAGGFLRLKGDFGKFLTSLQEVYTNVNLVGRSQLFLSEGVKSRIINGERRAVVTQSNITETGAINSTYQYVNIGVSLEAEILPGSDSENVKIRIKQTADSVSGFSEVSGDSVPVIGNREVSTVLTLPYGQAVVLGGLRRESVEKSVRGVPLLMRVPFLGAVFRDTVENKTNSELLVVIKPLVRSVSHNK